MNPHKSLGAVILAAGKGKRMKSTDVNKVALKLGEKPIILYAVHLFQKMHFGTIVIVVGHAKQSVIDAVSDDSVLFTEQKEQLGTGDALKTAVEKISDTITDVLVVGGDDSYLYNEQIISNLIEKHTASESVITFLTITSDNPFGIGRIIRDDDGEVSAIVEEKDATDKERKITEINPACYIFNVSFLKKYLPKISKSPVTGEYYLTSLVEIAIKNKEKIETVSAGAIPWRGINTPEELTAAERLLNN